MTYNTWHVTSVGGGVNILSKCQLPSSYGLGWMMFGILGGKGWITDFIDKESVCRTAPAIPGLLIKEISSKFATEN